MKQHSYGQIALAVATVLGGMWTSASHAALVTSQTIGFTMGSGTATDTCGQLDSATCRSTDQPSTALAPVSLATNFNQFNAATGVLTGVTIGLSSTRTQTVSGTVANPVKTGNAQKYTTSTASGTSGASVSATGANLDLAAISHSRTGAAGATIIPSNTTPATAANATLAVAASNLDAYVGIGTSAVTRQLSGVQATSTFDNGSKNGTSSKANYSVSWSGDLTMEFEYLLHALASFDADGTQPVLNINFGTHLVGASVAAQTFSIFNAIGANGVGLDFDDFDLFGAAFSTSLAQFDDLAAGGSSLFSIGFDTSTAGVFGGTYRLRLSDADVGVAASRSNYELTVNLSGTVREQPSQVPEPSMLALVGLGLMGLAVGRRRRR